MNDVAEISRELDSPLAIREAILGLQDAMLALNQPDNGLSDCPVTHHFAPGLYARQMLIPAGKRIVGKIHRHAHINTISQGRVTVFTEFGMKELQAPITFVSEPGTKRAVVAHEDTIWTTYHPTDETDLEKIEAHVIVPSYEALEAERKMIQGERQ